MIGTTVRSKIPLIIGISAIFLLALGAVLIAFAWSVPSFATREFEWGEIRATLVVQFVTDGPFSAGNEISAASAVFYVRGNLTSAGPVRVEIRGDANSSGSILFTFPPLTSFDGSHSTFSTASVGGIIPSSPERIGLRAVVELVIDDLPWTGWSQYISSPLEPLDVSIVSSPASDYYTFLGFKAVAASILVASAFAVFPAIESALEVARRR